MKIEERMRVAGVISGICSVEFAIPHFWFWCGVSFAYPDDFQEVAKNSALLIVGGLAALAAICAIAFTHSLWVRRLPEWASTLPALAISAGFMMWGLAYFGLQIQLAFNDAASSGQYFASVSNPNAIWGLYWYSLFIVWGLSLGVAAFYFHKVKEWWNEDEHMSVCETRDLTKRKQRSEGRLSGTIRRENA